MSESHPPPPDSEEEVPAGVLPRLLLVGTPFALLLVLFILDRLVRG